MYAPRTVSKSLPFVSNHTVVDAGAVHLYHFDPTSHPA